ncbi:hypothetical protein [Myceligenerans crystallogenes]|uniref:DUF8094 domain-containing protein n=1 Tax=Myceligenerans crystallogenes TaxID=316335 RepID=A0ABN2NMJ2_9MICO
MNHRRSVTGTRGRRTARRVTAAVAPVLAAGLLAGCAQELPVPEAEPAVVGAVVTEEQEKTIISRVAESVDKASKEKDAGALDRMTGPAKELRTSEIEVARILGKEGEAQPLPMTMQSVVLPSEPTWPRTSFAVSTQPKDLTPPVLYAFTQNSARSDYQMWAWADLLPGVTLPQFASTDTGTERVAPDDADSLVMSPQKALAAYADVIGEDKDSKYAKQVEDDEFRAFLRDQETRQEKADGWKEAEGKYSFSASADDDHGVEGMRTVDGGAIVMGAVNSMQVIQLQDGAEAPPSKSLPTQVALFGDQDVTNVQRTKYFDIVGLYIPPAGSSEKVRLVGFEHVAVSVSNE